MSTPSNLKYLYTIIWRQHRLSQSLPRSSHCLALLSNGESLIYSGELKPREPIDTPGALHAISLHSNSSSSSRAQSQVRTLSPTSPTLYGVLPAPRVGAASATHSNALYVWGGRGGTDMAPLDAPQAGMWKASIVGGDSDGVRWERIEAENESDAPEIRSYHCMVAAYDKLYIHAGCPSTGRSNSLHSFSPSSRTWTALASAPEPPRGGTALAVSKLEGETLILRFGGFAGYELPIDHTLDIYSPSKDEWTTVRTAPDPIDGYPGARSVHGFVGFDLSSTSSSRESSRKHEEETPIALLFYGERDASSLGHAGAGTFWDDAWVLVKVSSSSSSSFAWRKTTTTPSSSKPEARGWFPSVASGTGRGAVLMGGLVQSNERVGDIWVGEVDVSLQDDT